VRSPYSINLPLEPRDQIGSDGRLLTFDYSLMSSREAFHRVMQFSNYELNPSIPASLFSVEPPLGFSLYQLPYPDLAILIGEKLKLGNWKSKQGSIDIDSAVAGKLVIVRVPDSPPADELLAYIAKHALPVKAVVLSLGDAGGDYHSPSSPVADKLGAVGTPLMILLGADSSVKAIWMGFDSENPKDLSIAISAALNQKAP